MPALPSYRNQSIHLLRRSICWFLYDYMRVAPAFNRLIIVGTRESTQLNDKLGLTKFTKKNTIYTLVPEAVFSRCSVKKVFLEISQNSQENTCARVSFLIKLQTPATLLKKRLWYRCLPVNFVKFLRTPF